MDESIYKRPKKPKRMAIPDKVNVEEPNFDNTPQAVEVSGTTECHVTPPDVAARMVEYLEAPHGDTVLEPSAGTGNLIQALYENGHPLPDIVAIERSYDLCKVIRNRFADEMPYMIFNAECDCFLEYAAANSDVKYPSIIMNPPFKMVKKHMAAAIGMMGNSYTTAVLVALVPVTWQHPEAIDLEFLPNDTFAAAKVNTKIIRIER